MAKNPAGLRSFEYTALTPTGHTGKFVKQSSGKRGHGIAERVLDDFAAEYGKKMADTLAGYARTNFNIAD